MKYKPNSDYIFECEILSSGVNAKEIEDSLKKSLNNIINSNKPKFVALSNESKDIRESSLKLFSTIEEMQPIIGGKILHIGRIPDSWRNQLLKEMEEKKEADKKRMLHVDDCIMIIVEGKDKNYAVILDRHGVYSISSSPPK